MFERLPCWLRRRHEWGYRGHIGRRVVWLKPEYVDSIRVEPPNPDPLRMGEIGNLLGIPLYKMCRYCGKVPA